MGQVFILCISFIFSIILSDPVAVSKSLKLSHPNRTVLRMALFRNTSCLPLYEIWQCQSKPGERRRVIRIMVGMTAKLAHEGLVEFFRKRERHTQHIKSFSHTKRRGMKYQYGK